MNTTGPSVVENGSPDFSLQAHRSDRQYHRIFHFTPDRTNRGMRQYRSISAWFLAPVAFLGLGLFIAMRLPSPVHAQQAEPASSTPTTAVPSTVYTLPFAWEGAATISPAELAAVAPPLETLAATGAFLISNVPTESGNVIRILPEPDQDAAQPLSLILGWRLTLSDTNPGVPAAAIAAFSAQARLYSPPEGVRLSIQEQAVDWTSASTVMQDIAWTTYTVTKQISADATEVRFAIEWQPAIATGWLELRDLRVALYPPTDADAAAQLAPTNTPTPLVSPTPTPTETPPPAPTGTPTPELLVVTSTPTPDSVFAAATRVLMATQWARVIGAATETPVNMVTATFTPTPTPTSSPIVLIKTPTPRNAATATFMAHYATAVALTTGTPTPFPAGAVVIYVTETPPPAPANTVRPPTPTRTATPIFVLLEDIATATPAPTEPMPDVLMGKILFLSPHLATNPRVPNAFVINPDGTGVGLLSRTTFYQRAVARDSWSADRRFYVYALREGTAAQGPLVQLFYDDAFYNSRGHQLTYFGAGTAWAPAWSPRDNVIALVSSESKNDEIWLVRPNIWPAIQVTHNEWEWDQHPSFSPDGSTIVFHSNRVTGTRQLWLMDADGKNQRQLTNFPFEAFDPVWVKYPDS
jgi:hypothetical protein